MMKKTYIQPSVRTLHFAHRSSLLESSLGVNLNQSGGSQRSVKRGSAIWGNDDDEDQQPKSGIWQ